MRRIHTTIAYTRSQYLQGESTKQLYNSEKDKDQLHLSGGQRHSSQRPHAPLPH